MALVFQHRVTTGPVGGAGVAVHPDGGYVAVSSISSPFVHVYPWSVAGFGSKVSDPATAIPGSAFDVAWSPDGAYLAVAHASSPFVTVYNWTGTAFGSKVSDPATLPPSQANTVEFAPGGGQIIAGGPSGAWFKSWTWSAGWGAFLNNAPSLPGTPQRAAFSPDGAYVALAHVTTPRISAWNFSGSGFGSKLTSPTALGNTAVDVQFSPDGAYLAVVDTFTNALNVYNWSAGFGSKVSDPAVVPSAGFSGALRWTPDGSHLVVAINASTVDGATRQILAYEWAAGFGALVPHPDAQPGVTQAIDVTPVGNVIAADASGTSSDLSGFVIRSVFYVGTLAIA